MYMISSTKFFFEERNYNLLHEIIRKKYQKCWSQEKIYSHTMTQLLFSPILYFIIDFNFVWFLSLFYYLLIYYYKFVFYCSFFSFIKINVNEWVHYIYIYMCTKWNNNDFYNFQWKRVCSGFDFLIQ